MLDTSQESRRGDGIGPIEEHEIPKFALTRRRARLDSFSRVLEISFGINIESVSGILKRRGWLI